jgi:hypothetical protein
MALPEKKYSLKDKLQGDPRGLRKGLDATAKVRVRVFGKERVARLAADKKAAAKAAKKPGVVGRTIAAIKKKVTKKK